MSAAPSGTSRLYHCVDNVQFQRFDLNIYGPLSVTTQIEIAIHCVANKELIGAEGMILELDGSANIRWFDCSVLSAYGHENEQLLFAAPDRVQVTSIRNMNQQKRWMKFRGYLSAITLYDDLLRNKGSPKRQRGDGVIAQQIESMLQNMENAKDSDETSTTFMASHFLSFCANQKEIVLDIGYMTKYYPAISRLFVDESGEWLRYDHILRVHAYCEQISTSSFQAIAVTKEYLEAVLSMVQDLKDSNLQRIFVLNPTVQCEDEELTAFGDQFKEKGWKLGLNGGKLSISKSKEL